MEKGNKLCLKIDADVFKARGETEIKVFSILGVQ